jgi:hypothetical protein
MIPASFPPGFISVYGRGSTQGFSGFPVQYMFGVVNQLSGGGSGAYSLGQNVLFPYKESISLIYGNVNYYLVEEGRIVLTENPIEIIEPET